MVPNQRGFSPCGINDHCINKCSCLNRDFILVVPNPSRWRKHTVYTVGWWVVYFVHTQYSCSIYGSCLMFPRCEHAHRMPLFLSSMWRKTMTSSGLLASWWRWPNPACAFPRESLASEQGEELWAVWIVLVTCSQPPVLWDKTAPDRRGKREQLSVPLLSGPSQLGLYELLCQAMDLGACSLHH